MNVEPSYASPLLFGLTICVHGSRLVLSLVGLLGLSIKLYCMHIWWTFVHFLC
jgi:hypothetical protein